MPVQLCAECYLGGFCRRLTSRQVEDRDLAPAYVADVRRFMQSLGLSRDAWKPFLIDGYADYPGRIVDARGKEAFLDTSVFDARSIRYWFRDLLRPLPKGVRPRLKRTARERFKVTASILKALYPVPALSWGKDIANDDTAQVRPVPIKAAGCRYPHFGSR